MRYLPCFVAGVIDGDYEGDISVILFNHSTIPFTIAKGDRVAQLICEKIAYPELVEVKGYVHVRETGRGLGKFGSTGVGNAIESHGIDGDREISSYSWNPIRCCPQ